MPRAQMAPREAENTKSLPGKLHLIRDGFVAEIIHGRATGLFHFIITREHSPEIVCWGQEDSLDAARHYIDDFIVSENERKHPA